MPIKKSFLEQKISHRIARVLFWVFPFSVIAAIFLTAGGNIVGALEKNIVYIAVGLVSYFLILNVIWRIFLYIIFGGLEDNTRKPVVAAMPAVNQPAQTVAPLIVLIIVFIIAALFLTGSIELPQITVDPEPVQVRTYGAACSSKGKTGLYGTNGICYTCSGSTAATNPINNNCSNGIAGVYCCTKNPVIPVIPGDDDSPTCIPTGCGSLWRCSGSYYLGGQQMRVNGCYPVSLGTIYSDWSGTCRQCP